MTKKQSIKDAILKNVLAGLSVLVPLYLTVYIITAIVRSFDGLIHIFPAGLGIERIWFPGSGLILAFLLATTVGLLARLYIGRSFVRLLNAAIERVPLVASIYSLLRQVSESMLGEGGKSFSRVILVEWPRRDCWIIAFVTANTQPILSQALGGGKWLNVFVPTTPNPTSGFYFMVLERDVKELPISVDQAFKAIISAGSFPLGTGFRKDQVADTVISS